ncbi:hypothetical protein [Pedobacter sp. V48]|uniref:hypothetical protein n=1 Tax=Pedobacter sp. V48 TaxID=509635 RepID=UPI0003E593DB|nr:hypothetical protein [Pedobacter sp. V48]ETZ21351.1 hypothetical protein N824_28190 [Pedobacter sp. V48]
MEHTLKYKGVEIGQVKSYYKNYTSNKYFVTDNKGLWVWNAYTRSARSFSMASPFEIVGWVDNLLP